MNNSWDNFEPAPLEFFHGKLIDEFHALRRAKGENEQRTLTINGREFNILIARIKMMTYYKYPKQKLDKAIPKSEM